jgi:aspartate/methionine/tyrosine aminotransferase
MPAFNTGLDRIPLSVFEELESIICKTNHSHFFRLHQGRTYFSPCAHLYDWQESEFELLAHQHASPSGISTLKDKIVDKLNGKRQKSVQTKDILITCGATHAIETVLRAILDFGDEVLILSPQWLFIVGLVHAAGGNAVEVPVFLELSKNDNLDFIDILKLHLTEKTKAIYFNTPNNPTGYSLNSNQLQQLSAFAKKNNLWLIADNAYEIYNFTQEGFVDIADFPDAADRTFSVYSFSKTYAMPGYRIGYVVVPEEMEERIKKWGLYSIYALSTASQFGAFQALGTHESILVEHQSKARLARDYVMNNLVIPHTNTQGGLYTFLDFSNWHKKFSHDFLNEFIQAGVSVAPGIVFGKHCRDYARLCFTAVNLENLKVAIERLNKVYLKVE